MNAIFGAIQAEKKKKEDRIREVRIDLATIPNGDRIGGVGSSAGTGGGVGGDVERIGDGMVMEAVGRGRGVMLRMSG